MVNLAKILKNVIVLFVTKLIPVKKFIGSKQPNVSP